jgi:hypothetical protein
MQTLINNLHRPGIPKALIMGVCCGVVLGTVLYKVCYLLAQM